MKTMTIGRGEGCDILIDDYRISRRHALLKIYPFGKMEIVNLGQNGTWVNGVKLRPNVPFPVKRGDVVNFAETSLLNWKQIPNPLKLIKILSSVIIGMILAIILILVLWNTFYDFSTTNSYDNEDNEIVSSESQNKNVITNDSVRVETEDKNIKQSHQTEKKEIAPKKSLNELFPHKVEKKNIEKEAKEKSAKVTAGKKEEKNDIEIY